ncbi:unnamed protein product [Rotaria socialis]|uniref:Testis-expressed sequence 9 protein n=1 Tax=Rotaria socialis TaxID=392032 RepID=A0A821F2K2_9BILA|nr:unnamed protein product [Rotaria socialis]CAF3323694.1 unnamed protein product [Rotaria socialis]CAF3409335.1 unnamed protein product [Rotaria socialis]CAF3650200.1 unnamed protein product [Rotaria socialis]CAF4110845.1 unnamed protein product [Rotaria socialis]
MSAKSSSRTTGQPAAASAKPSARTPKPRNDYADQEEEYKRLNAQLEAKTQALVEEADQVLRNQNRFVSTDNNDRTYSLLDQVDTDDQLFGDLQIASSHTRDLRRPPSATYHEENLSAKNRKPSVTKFHPRVGDDVATVDNHRYDQSIDHTILQDQARNTFDRTVADIETKINRTKSSVNTNAIDNDEDDIFPGAAKDMGSEAKIRFLKARLRVMQEELERMHTECVKREEENERISLKVKESDDDRSRLNRVVTTLQDQLEKYKKLSSDTKSKLDTTEVELSSLRKEFDQTKRHTKKQQQDQTQTDTKLNRALEEAERYKQQLNKMQQSTKDINEQDKKKIEQLTNENRRLEKQRLELMNAFKRQLKLIDILKKQKLHLEASKMLQFAEEEFCKAIEWNTS